MWLFGKAGSLSLAFLLATPHCCSGIFNLVVEDRMRGSAPPNLIFQVAILLSPKTVQPKIGSSFFFGPCRLVEAFFRFCLQFGTYMAGDDLFLLDLSL